MARIVLFPGTSEALALSHATPDYIFQEQITAPSLVTAENSV